MQFKQKLPYMALGGLLVFMGLLLSHSLTGNVVAQKQDSSVVFDEVTCRHLKVVDATGQVLAEKKS
jgi:hypothetical protein